MAIASVGTLGTGVSSTSSTSFTLTTSAAVEANNVALLVVVTDNTQTTDGNSSDHTAVTDNSGATGSWSKLGEYTNGNGAAEAGVTTSVWMKRPTGNMASGTVITMTLGTARVDKCASAWEYTVGAALVEAATEVGNGVDASNGFGSVAFSGLASKQRLYFRGLGKEANSTTAITVSSNFTAITGTRSRNNTAAVIVRGEFRINTSTGETSNPTLAVSGDTAGVFVALEEGVSPTRGQISWAELETPLVATRGQISFAEAEVPFLATRGQMSWAEMEAPIAPTRGLISWTELESPSLPASPTRGQMAWAELEVGLSPTRGLVSWAEAELPEEATSRRARYPRGLVRIGMPMT